MSALAVPNLANDRCEFSPYRLATVARHYSSAPGENETLFNYRGDNPFYQALNKELHIKRRAVIQAVNEKQNIAAAVASMMGLGIGLTPSADDYLTGLVLILFISGHPAEKYKEEFYRGLQRGRNNTTLLSAITLEAALQQRCRENIHHFIHDIIYGVPREFNSGNRKN